MKLIGEFVARSAHSASLWAAALNHELGNHTVKNQPVVEGPFFFLASLFVGEFFCAFRQPDEIADSLGRFLFQQPHHDVSLRGLKNGIRSCRSAHAFSLRINSSYTSRTVPCHFAFQSSPTLALAQLRDVCGVMLPVPLVEKKQPVDVALAVLRMNEHARKLLGPQRAPDAVPAIMQRGQ